MKNNHSNKKKVLVDCHVFDGKGQGTTTYLKGIYSELVQDENILFYLISFYFLTVVGPISNPFWTPANLFKRNDYPVLYGPITQTTPIYVLMDRKKSIAFLFSMKFP